MKFAAPALSGRRWRDDVEYAVFMVAREAIANALLHAGCSEVCVRLEGGARWLRLLVGEPSRWRDQYASLFGRPCPPEWAAATARRA